jgi:hypothetical protein
MSRVNSIAQHKNALGRESDIDNDMEGVLAEQEYGKIQRQFRNLEADRKIYGDETRTSITKQQHIIDTLQQENIYLVEELNALKQKRDPRVDSLNSKYGKNLHLYRTTARIYKAVSGAKQGNRCKNLRNGKEVYGGKDKLGCGNIKHSG